MYKILNKEKYEELKQQLTEVKKGKSDKSISDILEEMKKYVLFIKEPQSEENIKDREIEEIINMLAFKYQNKTQEDAVRTFTEGFCYYFAIMLKKIFKDEAEIYTTMNAGHHAIVKIGENFYDVNGNIKKYFDRNGDIKNKIDPSDYLPTKEEYFLLFIDWCNAGRTKKEIERTEKICDEITEEMIKNLEEVKKNKI